MAARAASIGRPWVGGTILRTPLVVRLLGQGDWDGYSDVDVLALTEAEWLERRHGEDPYSRAIGLDAVRLSSP